MANEDIGIYELLDEAWERVGPGVLADEGELRARLSRRRAVAEARPPRAFCAAVRANDTRIEPMKVAMDRPAATREGHEAAHRVTIDSRLLKHLTALVNIPAPGMDMHGASRILGVYPSAIYRMIRDHRLGVRYKRGLRGQRGFPVPLVHTLGDFDPCGSGTLHLGTDRLWSGLAGKRSEAVPEGLEFEVERVPIHDRKRGGRFMGWRWLCPGCGRRAQVLYLPLDLPDFVAMKRIPVPRDEQALCVERPRALACRTCHRLIGFSGYTRANLESAWSQAVRYLSSGMLYGKEVRRPGWLRLGPAKMRHFLERDAEYLAHEAERRGREEVEARIDLGELWVDGRLNPIFMEPPPRISIDPATNKTIREDGAKDGWWRPQRRGSTRR